MAALPIPLGPLGGLSSLAGMTICAPFKNSCQNKNINQHLYTHTSIQIIIESNRVRFL